MPATQLLAITIGRAVSSASAFASADPGIAADTREARANESAKATSMVEEGGGQNVRIAAYHDGVARKGQHGPEPFPAIQVVVRREREDHDKGRHGADCRNHADGSLHACAHEHAGDQEDDKRLDDDCADGHEFGYESSFHGGCLSGGARFKVFARVGRAFAKVRTVRDFRVSGSVLPGLHRKRTVSHACSPCQDELQVVFDGRLVARNLREVPCERESVGHEHVDTVGTSQDAQGVLVVQSARDKALKFRTPCSGRCPSRR